METSSGTANDDNRINHKLIIVCSYNNLAETLYVIQMIL